MKFSKPYIDMYSNMAFSPNRDEYASIKGCRDAIRVLSEAADRCRDQDMRTKDVIEALAYLYSEIRTPELCAKFRAALDDPTPVGRVYRVKTALRLIEASVQRYSGKEI